MKRNIIIVEDDDEHRNILTVEDDDTEEKSTIIDTSIIPDDVMNVFWYFFGYNKTNINWIKLKTFISEYDLNLTEQQKLFLFNLKFRN